MYANSGFHPYSVGLSRRRRYFQQSEVSCSLCGRESVVAPQLCLALEIQVRIVAMLQCNPRFQ